MNEEKLSLQLLHRDAEVSGRQAAAQYVEHRDRGGDRIEARSGKRQAAEKTPQRTEEEGGSPERRHPRRLPCPDGGIEGDVDDLGGTVGHEHRLRLHPAVAVDGEIDQLDGGVELAR